MVKTSMIMKTVPSSFVNKFEIYVRKIPSMISITAVTKILKTRVNLEYFFAYAIFISPRKTPVKAEAA